MRGAAPAASASFGCGVVRGRISHLDARRFGPRDRQRRDQRNRKPRHEVVTFVSLSETYWFSELGLADNAVFHGLSAMLSMGGEVAQNFLPWPLNAVVSTLSFDLSNAFLGEITGQTVLHFAVSIQPPHPSHSSHSFAARRARSRWTSSTPFLRFLPHFADASTFFCAPDRNCRQSTTLSLLLRSPSSASWTIIWSVRSTP